MCVFIFVVVYVYDFDRSISVYSILSDSCALGWFLFYLFQKSLFCILRRFATCLKVFKTVFVFALRPFLPMWVHFFGFNGKMTKINTMAKNHFRGPKWLPKCLHGGFMGGICMKSGVRILIWAPQVQFFGTPQNAQNGSLWVFLAILGLPKMALWVPQSKF